MDITSFLIGILSSLIASLVILLIPKIRDYLKKLLFSRGPKIFPDDMTWHKWAFAKILNKNGRGKKAYFIEYSGSNAIQTIREALKHGWNVNLILKNPETEDSEYQKNRISHQINSFNHDFKKEIKEGQLKITTINQFFGIQIRYFEDTLLMMSWYIKFCYKDKELNTIEGHDNLNISITENMSEWNLANIFWEKKIKCLFVEKEQCDKQRICRRNAS